MDIDTLYTAGRDAGINFENEDSVNDLAPVWVAACMASAEWMNENFHDAMADVTAKKIAEIGDWAGKAHHDRTRLHGKLWSDGLMDAYSTSLIMNLSNLGTIVSSAVLEKAKKDVTAHLYDWFADCVGYHRDMAAGRAEDAAIRAIEMRRDN